MSQAGGEGGPGMVAGPRSRLGSGKGAAVLSARGVSSASCDVGGWAVVARDSVLSSWERPRFPWEDSPGLCVQVVWRWE